MNELPAGTVTFLFTDIEGSTRLLRQLGGDYASVLAEHQRILRKAVEEQGGREIDNQSESFFFAFGSASAAVGAAVLAQRALSEHAWAEEAAVRVRMGLHTGEPLVGEARYVGLGVHRAARIGAVGHGGQVLLSNATRELVEDGLAGVSIRDLGAYRLKDLDRDERLYQLEVAGLPSEFPPLKAKRVAEPRATAQTELQIGSEFLGYRIEELIGQGGMGVVYRAYDLRLKRTVALKLVTPELALDERFRERFARETELAMSLEHPNVVPIHDAGDVAGRLYLAMRLVTGTDLRKLLHAEGALEPPRALAICGQVAHALDAAHARALVHRDVKPSNVLLDENEHVYLADFGLTRRLEEQGAQTLESRSVGTPAYVAPEQIEAKPVDGRADVYSVGCLLFECLTGKPPYLRDSRLATAWAHLEEDPPSATELNPELPQAIDAVFVTALAKEPQDRYPTCAALAAAAAEALGLGAASRSRRRGLLVAAAILALVGISLVAALAQRDSSGSAPTVRPNTLVRIDPARSEITDVVGVSSMPAATAVGGRSVWVYGLNRGAVTEVAGDGASVRKQVRLSATPAYLGLLTGPFLDADSAGAWIVGTNSRGAGLLTRILSGRRGKREYGLSVDPVGVAVAPDAVWVLGHADRGDQLLRVDPGTGTVTRAARFPDSARVDSLTVGLGRVWVVGSASGVLYRVDPRSAKLTGHIDLGSLAGRPSVHGGRIWVGVSDETVVVDPRDLHVIARLACCRVGEGSAATGFGSTWTVRRSTGGVVRFSGATGQVVKSIRVADSPPFGGPCLTSIAAGGGGVWVTVAPGCVGG